jgi:ankyrin repeat protein
MEVPHDSIYQAAALGDADAVRRCLVHDMALARLKDDTGWDPLTHLCFSKWLRTDRTRAAGFFDAATALLDAGADANAGFYEGAHPQPVFESVLYAAAGLARDAALTRLLLERGADPNDGEVPYHAPETHDNDCLRVLLGSGRLNEDSLATMLLRKCDWHDIDGIALLLEYGADPNRVTPWGYTALHQALRRDNALEIIALLFDHGADATTAVHGRSFGVAAAWEGRSDVLTFIRQRGDPFDFHGVDRLVAACTMNDIVTIRALTTKQDLVWQLLTHQTALLREFAGIGNTDGVRCLLDLGVDVSSAFVFDDAYWGVGEPSTALHVAAWRARHPTVALLIERGASVDVQDGNGQTPLMLAVRACVNSYWMRGRSPQSVAALLAAGASIAGVNHPTGYEDIDVLLADRA